MVNYEQLEEPWSKRKLVSKFIGPDRVNELLCHSAFLHGGGARANFMTAGNIFRLCASCLHFCNKKMLKVRFTYIMIAMYFPRSKRPAFSLPSKREQVEQKPETRARGSTPRPPTPAWYNHPFPKKSEEKKEEKAARQHFPFFLCMETAASGFFLFLLFLVLLQPFLCH